MDDHSDVEALQDELKRTWKSAYTIERERYTQVLIAGVNFRLNVAGALKTVYLSAKIYFKTKKAITVDPWTVLDIAKDVYELANAALDALIQDIQKSRYTVAVVLSRNQRAVSEEELHKSVLEFIGEGEAIDAPWYLHITRKHLDETRDALEQPQGLLNLLTGLQGQKLAEQTLDGKWKFVDRHWTWTSTIE
jgi:hypothetical protein